MLIYVHVQPEYQFIGKILGFIVTYVCKLLFLLFAVCRAQSLMPAVQSGNVLKVDAILNSLNGDQTTNKETGGSNKIVTSRVYIMHVCRKPGNFRRKRFCNLYVSYKNYSHENACALLMLT